MKVVEKDYTSSIDILKIVDHYVAHPIMVSDEGITADANGNKIVKAGSFLDKTGKIVADGTVQGVLLKDTDVTYGPAGGACLVHAFIDVTKLPVEPTAEIIAALPMVKFEGEDYTSGI